METRLIKEMMKILKLDKVSQTRPLIVRNSNIDLLLGFNFNKGISLRSRLNVGCKTIINRATGEVYINISSFIPTSAIKAIEDTTHFIITSAAVEISFDDGTVKSDTNYTERMPLNSIATTRLERLHRITPGTNKSVIIVLGLQFYNEANLVSVHSFAHQHPLCIIEINKVHI